MCRHRVRWRKRTQGYGNGSALDNYTTSATPEQRAQIEEAIAASPALAAQLHDLAAAQLLSGVTAIESVSTPTGKPSFAGFTEGSQIVLTAQLMSALQQRRLFDVVSPGDVLPNQTVFVLAHLAHHLRTNADMRAALKEAPGPDAYVKLRLQDESVAFIEAWNATVDAATPTEMCSCRLSR